MSGDFIYVLLFVTTNYIFMVTSASVIYNNNVVVPVKEVTVGDSVVLSCKSNDEKHNFNYWQLAGKDLIIGPSNKQYDQYKFRFEILSGNLTIKGVTKEEEGLYSCVSRGVHNNNVNIKSVRMVVQKDWEEVSEHDSAVNTFRIVIIIITLLVLGGGAFLAYKIWKDRYRFPRYLEQSEDDDDSAEELFSAPGTSAGTSRAPGSIVINKSSNDDSSISTDFTSILDTASNK